MSILQYPDSINVQQLQVWNNDAFDNGESEDTSAVKLSWANLKSVQVNQSLESDATKENQSPFSLKSPVSFKSSSSIVNPLCSMNFTENSKERTLKRDEKRIDSEIGMLEKEMARISMKIESLRLEKAEYSATRSSMRGRTVPAKCMGQKQSTKNFERTSKKFEDPLFSSPKTELKQRGVTLGPMEIFSAMNSKNVKREITTPFQSIQSRSKSCFLRLQDIDEGKVKRKSWKSLSVSPKSRRTISKVQAHKPAAAAATTIGSKREVKKAEGVRATIQPKKLFRDGEETPLKPRRLVASSYNQIGSHQSNGNLSVNSARKRCACCEQKVDSSSKYERSESRVRKKWEIPDEVMVLNGEIKEDVLPKIKTMGIGIWGESPRDSGKTKRVVESMDGNRVLVWRRRMQGTLFVKL